MRKLFALLFALALPAWGAPPKYYVVVFWYQQNPNLARESHSFATFLKDSDAGLEEKTISWLPDYRQPIIPLGVIQRGHNYDLDETLRIAGRRHTVGYWGPYEIRERLWEGALERIRMLRPGIHRYKMIDYFGGGPNDINCVHAAGNLMGTYLDTGTLWGRPSSQRLVQHYRPWMVQYPVEAADVARRMRLKERVDQRGP